MDPVSSAAEKLINDAGPDVIVHNIPSGEPLFMFSSAVGKTRPVTVFYDSGCSHVMFKEGIQKELDSVVVRKGPISISAAGNVTVEVNDEIAVTMERTDGSRQIMVGVTADELTTEFPMLDVTEAHKEIIAKTPRFKKAKVSQLSVPTLSGGQPDVLLGIKYQSVHPQIVHQLKKIVIQSCTFGLNLQRSVNFVYFMLLFMHLYLEEFS